jgi:tetratricopeptide (TPR) repeat protein
MHPSEEMQAIYQAQIFKDNKKYDEAIGCLIVVLEKKERSARIMSMIGDIFDAISNSIKNNEEEKKKYSNIAENWYKKAVNINTQYIKVHNSLGKHYELLGEKEKALESYESASHLSPLNPTRMMRIGEIALETGHIDKADRAFEALSKIQSTKKTDTLKEMGELYLKHGHTDKALKIFNKSLDELEDSAIYNRLGITLRKQKRFLEAIEQYKKAIKLSPNDEVLYYNIGKAYLDAGNKVEAKLSLEQAVKIDKDFVEAALELKKL